MKTTCLVISCEHAVNTVPPNYAHAFQEHPTVLDSGEAYDPGALTISQQLSQRLDCDLVHSEVTRLLIDCNRSLSHADCFSPFSRGLASREKQHLIDAYYSPFRDQTQRIIQSHLDRQQQVLHLSIHSVNPALKTQTNRTDLGLFYDSSRHGEQEVARLWRALLLRENPGYRIRKNYPYSGNKFSFPQTFRKHYSEQDYLGLEVEINQSLLQEPSDSSELIQTLSDSLQALLELL